MKDIFFPELAAPHIHTFTEYRRKVTNIYEQNNTSCLMKQAQEIQLTVFPVTNFCEYVPYSMLWIRIQGLCVSGS